MSSTISIHLLVCMLVFLPSCCRGLKEPCKPIGPYYYRLYTEYYCKDDLLINSTNWYQNLNIKEIEKLIQRTIWLFEDYHSGKEERFSFKNLHLNIDNPSYGLLVDTRLFKEGYSTYRKAEIITKLSIYIRDKYCSSIFGNGGLQCAKQLSKVKLDRTSLGEMCLSEYYNKTTCIGMNLKYRSPDGSCNNLERSFLGKATTAYKRLLFPAYIDGLLGYHYIPPIIPNPRLLSNELVNDEHSPDHLKTMAMAYWTIFIGHDLSHTAMSSMMNSKKPVICCRNNGLELSPYDRNHFCMEIEIPDNDKFFNRDLNKEEPHKCMNYVRSAPAMRSDCTFGPKEQMNQATHYLDGSMVYGSSAQRTWLLRTKSDGQLLTNMGGDNISNNDFLQPQYMPLEDTESNACQYGSGTCYRAGDIRANWLPQLTVMHTLWMREHNRLAKLLSHVNPHWDDERIFQEARKIVTASIQHITYAEWLPALLGENYTRGNELELSKKEFSNAYNETTDPTVSNSFATAILPFANSMLSDTLSLYSEARVNNGNLSLKEHFNRPTDLMINYMDQLVRGLSTQNTQKVDMLFTQTLTNYLYTVHPVNLFGMDIVSLDIQRSRDHGIPSYMQFRKYCGLKDIKNSQDLSQIMVEGSAERLLKHYKIWEIELMIGALFEKHEDDSMVGPTMRCIIREQFIRTRIADRYFYDLPKVFNKYQLTEIRKVTLARIFCDNSNNVTSIQQRVFLKPETADLKLCNSQLIPKINLNHWTELVDAIQK